MIAVINLLKEQKDKYDMMITHIRETTTPKGDFLCMCNPTDIPRLQKQLKEYELFVADLERAIKILNEKTVKQVKFCGFNSEYNNFDKLKCGVGKVKFFNCFEQK